MIVRRLRDGEERAWIPRPTEPLPDTLLPCAVAMLLWVVAVVVAVLWLGRNGGEPSLVAGLTATAGVNLVIALGLLPHARHAAGVAIRRTRLAGAGITTGLAAFAAVHVTGIVLILVYAALGHELPTQEVVETVRGAAGAELVLAAVAAIVIAPFAEEVFFRGILLPAFGRFVPVRQAVLLQALIFGLFHFPGDLDRLPLALPLALVGLFAGWLYVRTRSILAVTLLHATFNGVQFALLLASR